MIDFNGVSYNYVDTEQKKNLKDINLTIPKGQFILITGKSGCGKTTLSQCINGLIPYFNEGKLEGDIFVNGNNTKDMNIGQIGQKIGSVFQNPRTQFFTTSTLDEIALGCQNMSLPREEILARIENVLHCFKIEDLKERSIFQLSSGEKQKVAFCSCYIMQPQIFLLDEPSANLDLKAVEELTEILKDLKAKGYTIVIMEHRLYYLKDLIDRVIYMKEGEIVKDFTRKEALNLSKDELENMGLRVFDLDKLKNNYDKDQLDIEKDDFIKLEIEKLKFDYCKKNKKGNSSLKINNGENKNRNGKTLLENINFKAQSGDIIGIIGKNGAGKTTLARILSGLLKNNEGVIKVNGKVLNEKERLKTTYFVLQDSDYQLFTDSVEKELTLGNEGRKGLKEKGEKILEYLGLSDYLKCHPAALSRGQKQRLTIAGGLLSEAPILLFDEPTSGLDGESMREVIKLIKDIRKSGKIVFVISHDYEFLNRCCTSILEIKDGIVGENFELKEENLEKLKKCLFREEE